MPLLLQFAADYPGTAFLLSWPLMLLLLGVAWATASLLNNAVNGVTTAFVQAVGAIIVLFRGYPKVPEDGDADKPLAS